MKCYVREERHVAPHPAHVLEQIFARFGSLNSIFIRCLAFSLKPFNSFFPPNGWSAAKLGSVDLVTAPCAAVVEFLDRLSHTHSAFTLQNLNLGILAWSVLGISTIQARLVKFRNLQTLRVGIYGQKIKYFDEQSDLVFHHGTSSPLVYPGRF
jgi:hypothetical protein